MHFIENKTEPMSGPSISAGRHNHDGIIPDCPPECNRAYVQNLTLHFMLKFGSYPVAHFHVQLFISPFLLTVNDHTESFLHPLS